MNDVLNKTLFDSEILTLIFKKYIAAFIVYK